MTELSIQPITDPGDPRFALAETLYREAFPASERKPIAFLAEALDRDDYTLLCATSGGEFVGMALVYRSRLGFALLEYMAVAEAKRGGGHGGLLFATIAERVGCPLVLEVESERAGEDEEARMRKRRLDFYRRLGCLTVAGLAYVMPQVSTAPPPPMDLLLHGSIQPPLPGVLCAWLDDIYVHVYGRATDDPALVRMRDSVGRQVILV